MTRKSHAGNLCATTFKPSEAVPVGSTNGQFLLEIVGVDDFRQSLLDVDIGGLPLQAAETVLGSVVAALANLVPGAVRGEVKERDQEERPHPLQREGNAEAPFIVTA